MTLNADKYRPDIDGLRAVAVLAVVLFHSGVQRLSGGYVGVDVFFVISGYLITGYVDQRIAAGKFSILEFYERRTRRIAPALFFFLLCASIVAYFALLPDDLVNYAKSAIATVFFVPNVLSYYVAGYFDSGAKLKPLLHLWSLGVEEQFYIFFPPLLLLVSRRGRRSKLFWVWLAFAVSLALSIWWVQHNHETKAAFYLVPFRAWELLTGALLALGTFPRIESLIARNVLAAIGLLAIFVSIFSYTQQTPFPGLTAALPCFGTALVIYANESGPVLAGRLLSFRPMVGVGLISYSLYLWHWPVIVYVRQLLNRPLTAFESAVCVLVSFAGSILSWKFVEQPFRKGPTRVPRNQLFFGTATVAAGLTVLAGICILAHGFRQRFPQQALVYANDATDVNRVPYRCTSAQQVENLPACHLGLKGDGPPAFLLWGDSHAGSLAWAFNLAGKEDGETGWVAFRNACLPLPGIERPDYPGCDQFTKDLLQMIQRHDIRTIVLVARWSVGAMGLSPGELEEGTAQARYIEPPARTHVLEPSLQLLERGLRRLLSDPILRGRKVLLVIDVPNTGFNTPRHLAWSVIQDTLTPYPHDVYISMSTYARQSLLVDALLVRLAEEYNVLTIDTKTELCQGYQCLVARQGHSMYRDSHHLTTFGAEQLVHLLYPMMPAATVHRNRQVPLRMNPP